MNKIHFILVLILLMEIYHEIRSQFERSSIMFSNSAFLLFSIFCGFLPSYCEDSDLSYKFNEIGLRDTAEFRGFYTYNNKYISPVHDIPMFHDENNGIFNLVVEIPRWSNSKMEMNMVELLNPIKQDLKNNKLRYVHNLYPFHGYPWNYGAIPQTWERPVGELRGDNDPIDVIEIGTKKHGVGDIVQVKVLGAIGLIDEGEMDWKVIAIDVTDSLANKLEDVSDLSKLGNVLPTYFNWFKFYKYVDNEKTNTFLSDTPLNRTETLRVIHETHEHWKGLVNKAGDINNRNCHYAIEKPGIDVTCLISQDKAKTVIENARQSASSSRRQDVQDSTRDNLFYVNMD